MASQNEVLVQGTLNSETEFLPNDEARSFNPTTSLLARVATRAALAIGIAIGTIGGETATIDPPAAIADTGGYPEWNKPCVAGDPMNPDSSYGKTTGTGYWCNNYEWGDSPSQQNSSRGYGYRNCTDWVAWRIPQLVQRNVPTGWHNAENWDNAASAAHYTVDNTPEPGDIAVWEGTYGHVAVVESVNSNGSVNVSEYNHGQDGNFGTRNNVTGVDHFIDLNGTGKGINGEDLGGGGGGGGDAPPPNVLLVRQGNTLLGKSNLADMWSTLTYAASDMKAAEERIAIRDVNGNIVAKDGVGGLWYNETGPADEYFITPNMLVVRQGGAIYAKERLYDTWTTLAASGAVDVEVARNRIAYKDTSGMLWAKEGINGMWYAETSGVGEFDITSNFLLVRQGTTLLGKAALYDQWTTLATDVTNVEASAQRIAITDSVGNLLAKDGLNGLWYAETNGAGQYVVTPNLLLVRQGNTLIGKVGLGDLWSTLGQGIADVKAGGNRIVVRDTSGNILAKEGLGGMWLTETNGADQTVIAAVE